VKANYIVHVFAGGPEQLLAEFDSQPQRWLTNEEFMASVGPHINRK
jgi:hypothetical protein